MKKSEKQTHFYYKPQQDSKGWYIIEEDLTTGQTSRIDCDDEMQALVTFINLGYNNQTEE